MLTNLPDAFIKNKGIVVVPTEELGFKERVKNDIVLVEAVPEFKPTVVKRDYEDEGRLRKEKEFLEREKQLQERERELNRREAQKNNNGTWIDKRIKKNPIDMEVDDFYDRVLKGNRKRNHNKKHKPNFNWNIRIGK